MAMLIWANIKKIYLKINIKPNNPLNLYSLLRSRTKCSIFFIDKPWQNAKQMCQKELAFVIDIRAQSLGESLAKLEAANYVTRTPTPADKRMMIVT